MDQSVSLPIHLENYKDWEKKLKSELPSFLTSYDFDRIYKFLHPFAKSVVIEYYYVDKDFRDSYYNFFSKKFANHQRNCVRLHFFCKKIAEDELWNLENNCSNDYLGYIVLRPIPPFSIGRTMIDPEKINMENHLIFTSKENVHLLGSDLIVKGFPFTSQDSEVNVCAHASIWMISRYFSNRYQIYREAYPFEIANKQMYSHTRNVPSKGLFMDQVSGILKNLGFAPEYYPKDLYPDDFFKLIYYYIESGFPLLIGLPRHATVLIGHHFELDFKSIKKYEKNKYFYYNSADLISDYVINDDNFLPYGFLSKDKTKKTNYSFDDIDSFIVCLPEKVYLSAEYLEELIISILNTDISFSKHSLLYNKDELILRIYLTSSKSYKSFRRNVDGQLYDDIEKIYLEMPMPKFIWVAELSNIENYKKGNIFGEIIIDATANRYDDYPFLSIHYPGFLMLNNTNILGNDPSKFETFNVDKNKIKPYNLFKRRF
ncbi:MAG: hypothetical protein RBU23_12035 [Candidatus Auribacterota bacterium]|jgi:hypothetical protein|nr:hypothetical protein [Candidatus Auribacterota bacterium]